MTLSKPNAVRSPLRAAAPAQSAMTASAAIQTIVSCSRRTPVRTAAACEPVRACGRTIRGVFTRFGNRDRRRARPDRGYFIVKLLSIPTNVGSILLKADAGDWYPRKLNSVYPLPVTCFASISP